MADSPKIAIRSWPVRSRHTPLCFFSGIADRAFTNNLRRNEIARAWGAYAGRRIGTLGFFIMSPLALSPMKYQSHKFRTYWNGLFSSPCRHVDPTDVNRRGVQAIGGTVSPVWSVTVCSPSMSGISERVWGLWAVGFWCEQEFRLPQHSITKH